MSVLVILLYSFVSSISVSITEPVDGETYNGDWLTVRAVVENDDVLPDSVHYCLNGSSTVSIPRLVTDWYTYMANDSHTGFSESPAPEDNTILWTAPVTGTIHEFPTPVVVDGLVYYPQNEDGDTLFALDAATGEVQWIFTGTGSTDDAVTVKDGWVYTASDSIWCLDALRGDVRWSSGYANWSGGTPVVQGNQVYCGATLSVDSSRICCMDAATGYPVWESKIPGMLNSCMTLSDNKLYVPSYGMGGVPPQFLLHALNADNGAVVWMDDDSYRGFWDSTPTIVDGQLYIGGTDGWLRAYDAETGEITWKTFLTGEYITSTPAYSSNVLYVGAQDPPFAAVKADDGSFIWTTDLEIHGSPAIAEDMVFFGEYSHNDSARVMALDCMTGDTVWTYMTNANRFQGSPSIVDGVLYIPAIDGSLYAFGTGLKYTYDDDLFAELGSNELIVTSFYGGMAAASDTICFTVTGTQLAPELHGQTMQSFSVLSAEPNPFMDTVNISFYLPEAGHVSVRVFDLSGRSISVLADEAMPRGYRGIQWDGRDSNGVMVPPGLYFCRIESEGEAEAMGLCLLR